MVTLDLGAIDMIRPGVASGRVELVVDPPGRGEALRGPYLSALRAKLGTCLRHVADGHLAGRSPDQRERGVEIVLLALRSPAPEILSFLEEASATLARAGRTLRSEGARPRRRPFGAAG